MFVVVINVSKLVILVLTISLICTAYGSSCPKVHGGALTSRSLSNSPGWTMLNTGNPITCDGYVTAWRFYPTASAEFLTLVMRPHIAGSSQYVVVGRTVIPKQQVLNTEREFTLSEPDWISVKSGDVIGFKFETSLLLFDDGGTTVIYRHGISQNDLLVHTVHTINGGSYMRTYSFQAVLKNSYLPCNIINWPIMKKTTLELSNSLLWMDDWNKIKCAGTVTGWRYITSGSADIIGLVFRAVDADNNVYEIIGKTIISPSEDQVGVLVKSLLAYSDRIQVLPGDKIGFTYTGSSVYVKTDWSNAGSLYKSIPQPAVYDIGTEITFIGFQVRQYTFEAVLDDQESNSAYESTIIEDYQLQNNEIATISDCTLTSCVTNCIKNQQCKSVNYNQNTCKLNDATRTEDESNFAEIAGERYIEMSHKMANSVSHCAFVDCGPGNICIDIPGIVRRHLCLCSETGYLAEQCPSAECLEPLGVESGDIFDGQLSASSVWSGAANHGPKCGRLNGVNTAGVCIGAWAAAISDTNMWFQIHLMVEHSFTGIQTQGRQDLDQWMKTFTISYIKVNQVGEHFICNSDGDPKIFDGNVDRSEIRTHYFNPILQGVAIRIYPKSWHSRPNIRTEVLGCRTGNEWVRVFKGVSMTGVSIYNAWQTGSGTSSHHAHQFLISDTFYRNNAIFDNWATLNIQQVKLTAFSAFHEELFSITFDSVGSTTSSWFSKDRVQSSPWDDMEAASSNIFSIEGTSGSRRRFYMSNYHNGCGGDKGWFAVVEGNACGGWDGYGTNPRIIYSRTNSAEIWYTGYIGTARAMTFDVIF
ncbi:uncharacterized protein [Antedon mediterranea]|uniref:uncharacterized protein n=1 Tax=Antedon mediterranea TaxID=105859 RepID=UPI003AF98839